MGRSEMALLRGELARTTDGIKGLQDAEVRAKAGRDRTRAGLEEQTDLLVETVAGQGRGLAKYASPNAPSSTNSMHNAERDVFWKRLAEEGGGGPEPDDCAGVLRRGPLGGHEGASHGNMPSRSVRLRLRRCQNCGRGGLRPDTG